MGGGAYFSIYLYPFLGTFFFILWASHLAVVPYRLPRTRRPWFRTSRPRTSTARRSCLRPPCRRPWRDLLGKIVFFILLLKDENDVLAGRLQHYPLLRHKLHLLATQLRSNNFLDKTSVGVTTLALLFRKDQNISQKYKKNSLDTTCT